MNNIHVISIIQMLAGAIIIGLSIMLSFRSGIQHDKKQQTKWLFTISLILSGVYLFLIISSIKNILPAEALSGGFALVCSLLIAVIAKGNRDSAHRLQEEIAEHNISKDKIIDLSLTDELTSLYNRRGFISIVEKHLIRLRRLNKRAIFFYIELNNLQEINRQFGYEEGDMVLANVGTLMTATFRQADIIARIGDDEFMACLVDADVADMETVKNNFQDKLSTYNEKRSLRYKLSVSFAISSFDPVVHESALDMISRASASIKMKKRRQNSSRTSALSEDKYNNLTLIVSNMSSTSSPVDIKIYIDGELEVDGTFDTGIQNAWKPFHFKLASGKHSIKAKSVKGMATVEQEFKMKKDHWASVEYYKDAGSDEGARSLSGKLLFKLHDVPIKHRFVRPVKKFV
jgi:diguanylate cyclase (GGDEF)-like protein